MSVRDLITANAELLLDPGHGLAELWVYTPPGTDPVPTEFYAVFDQSQASGLIAHPLAGDEQAEAGILEAQGDLEFSTDGTATRAADGTVWRIRGIVGRDRNLQALELHRVIQSTARMARRRGAG